MSEQRFRGMIERQGRHGVIRLPFSPDEVWGKREQHHLTGSIGFCGIRAAVDDAERAITLGPAWMRDFRGPIDAEVDIALRPEGPQVGSLAADVEAALDSDPEAKAFFSSLATFYRNGFIKGIEEAKRAETRKARIEEMMKLLREKRKQK